MIIFGVPWFLKKLTSDGFLWSYILHETLLDAKGMSLDYFRLKYHNFSPKSTVNNLYDLRFNYGSWENKKAFCLFL